MIFAVLGLLVLALVIFSIPSGPKCPECEKHFTIDFKGKATRTDNEKRVVLEFKHCYYCKHKWDLKEDGIAIDEFGNPL